MDWIIEAARLIAIQVVALVLAFAIGAWLIRDYNSRHKSDRGPGAYCAYCGALAEDEDQMVTHINECDVHPLRRMHAEVRRLHGEMKRIYEVTGDPHYGGIEAALAAIRSIAGSNF